MATKKKPVKDKVKAKAKAVKGKVKGKVKTVLALVGLSVLFAGCSTATPASRATTATVGDVSIENSIAEIKGASCPCSDKGCACGGTCSCGDKAKGAASSPLISIVSKITFGDMALASADSAGSTETQTATPTLDIKPDVNVNYAQGGGITNRGTGGGAASGAAGVLEKLLGSLTDEGIAALKSALASKEKSTVTLAKKDGTTTTAQCENGTCTFEDGTTVTAADCESCTAK